MDHLSKAVAAAVALIVSGAAHAGYAQLSPPPGFTSSGTSYAFRAAANSATILQNTVRTNAALNVGGRSVLVPAAMRFAANAPSIAARFVYVNPALAIGVSVGALALSAWLQSGGIKWDGNKWVKGDDGGNVLPSDGMEYSYGTGSGTFPGAAGWQSTKADACNASAQTAWKYDLASDPTVSTRGRLEGDVCVVTYIQNGRENNWYRRDPYTREGTCPVGWYVTPAGCVQTLPSTTVTPEEFEQIMAPKTLPDNVPQHLPIDLPVERPIVNPDESNNPSRFYIPQGDPRLVPDSNPQRWETPTVEVNPSPTPSEPWRVNTTPKDVVRPTPEPIRDIEPYKPPTPDRPEPTERTPDLCEKYPNILACQELDLDTPDGPELPNVEKAMDFLPMAGFGPDNATCPPPRHLQMMGQNIPVPFDLFCTYMSGMRPIIIAMAWLSAAFILVRRND